MDCSEAKRSLSLLADERLGAEEIGTLEEHLGACADCARFARTVEAVKAYLGELPCPPAPPNLTERVLARLGEPGSRLLAFRPMLRRVAAAAALLLVITGPAALWVEPGQPKTAASPEIRFTADGALDWIMSEIARENAPRIDAEEVK